MLLTRSASTRRAAPIVRAGGALFPCRRCRAGRIGRRTQWATLVASALLGCLLPARSSAQHATGDVRAPDGRPPTPGDTVILRVADVRRLTLTHNPAFLAARQESAIARGALQQARVLRFNPDITAAAPGVGTTSARNPVQATLIQELEVAGQRGLRIDAARVGVSRTTAVVQNSARLGVADVTVAFYRALSAERRLGVTRDGLTLTTRLIDAVRTQVREGEISALEGTLAEIEFGRAQARVLAAERLATASVLELKRLVGVAAERPVRLEDPSAPSAMPVGATNADSLHAPPAAEAADSAARMLRTAPAAPGLPDPASLDVDSLARLALAQRPDFAASSAAVREFETLTSLARREALPNPRVGVLAEQVPNDNGLRVGPAVGLSLPLWNRNQGLVSQRRAQSRQARLQRQAIELRIRTDVETAVQSYRSATREAAAFESAVRQPARVNAALLETAFRAGKIALPTLLLLRNQLLDAELGYWDAWLARQDALVQLDAATGLLARDALSAADSSTTPSGTSR